MLPPVVDLLFCVKKLTCYKCLFGKLFRLCSGCESYFCVRERLQLTILGVLNAPKPEAGYGPQSVKIFTSKSVSKPLHFPVFPESFVKLDPCHLASPFR